jgi:hypothetical protein
MECSSQGAQQMQAIKCQSFRFASPASNSCQSLMKLFWWRPLKETMTTELWHLPRTKGRALPGTNAALGGPAPPLCKSASSDLLKDQLTVNQVTTQRMTEPSFGAKTSLHMHASRGLIVVRNSSSRPISAFLVTRTVLRRTVRLCIMRASSRRRPL